MRRFGLVAWMLVMSQLISTAFAEWNYIGDFPGELTTTAAYYDSNLKVDPVKQIITYNWKWDVTMLRPYWAESFASKVMGSTMVNCDTTNVTILRVTKYNQKGKLIGTSTKPQSKNLFRIWSDNPHGRMNYILCDALHRKMGTKGYANKR